MQHTHSDGTVVDFSKINFGDPVVDPYHSPSGVPVMIDYDAIAKEKSVKHLPDAGRGDFAAWDALAMYLAHGTNHDHETLWLTMVRGVRTIAVELANQDKEGDDRVSVGQRIRDYFDAGIEEILKELRKWRDTAIRETSEGWPAASPNKGLPNSITESEPDGWATDPQGDEYPVWNSECGMFGEFRKYLNAAAKNAMLREAKRRNKQPGLIDDVWSEDVDDDEHQSDRIADEESLPIDDAIEHYADDEIQAEVIELTAHGESVSDIAVAVGRGKRYVSDVRSRIHHEIEDEYNLPHKPPGKAKRRTI